MMWKILVVLITVSLIVSCRGESTTDQLPKEEQGDIHSADGSDEQSESAISGGEKARNRPPRVTSVDVDPLYPKVGDVLRITATTEDPDDEDVQLIYEWFKNDIQLQESTNVLSLTKVYKRGDTITLNVIPNDGKDKGRPGRMTVTVGNCPPEINSSPSNSKFENRVFSYQVMATDKDRDALTYSLKTAPGGMTVQKSTGFVQWNVPQEYRGKASITISVTDGHGGEAVQSFSFEIAAEAK